MRIQAGPEGNVFVVDEGQEDLIIELFSTGEEFATYTEILPKVTSISDFVVLANELWIADLLGSSIHVLDRRTRTWRSEEWESAPYRVKPATDDPTRLVVSRVGAPYLFDMMTIEGKILSSFGLLLHDQKRHALLLDGFIVLSGSDILYSGRYLGVLASFSSSGSNNWLRLPIEPPEAPVLMERDEMQWVHHSPILASLSIAATDKRFYVLSRRPERARVRSFIDVYATDSGRYLHSFGLPASNRWTSMTIGGENLYVASDSRIVYWPDFRLKELASPDRYGTMLATFSSHQEQQVRKKLLDSRPRRVDFDSTA